MSKTILITGSTDGIGLETAKLLNDQGHTVLLHGRSEAKLESARAQLTGPGTVEAYRADLSQLNEVRELAQDVAGKHTRLDVLINNAGVFKIPQPVAADGQDLRFVVNTVAPYLLTRELLPLLPADGRVVNLSSAAQAPVNLAALRGGVALDDNMAYAQSKLALTMWSAHLARELGAGAPVVVAVNPASFLGSKMVKDAYGVAGGDLAVGADILARAALSDEFAAASGRYYDNDNRRFADPHPEALDPARNAAVVTVLDALIAP